MYENNPKFFGNRKVMKSKPEGTIQNKCQNSRIKHNQIKVTLNIKKPNTSIKMLKLSE